MFGINDEHDFNVVSMNSLNIPDVNAMQSNKLGDAMFDEDAFFVPRVSMRKFIMMIACFLFMTITMMNVGL